MQGEWACPECARAYEVVKGTDRSAEREAETKKLKKMVRQWLSVPKMRSKREALIRHVESCVLLLPAVGAT